MKAHTVVHNKIHLGMYNIILASMRPHTHTTGESFLLFIILQTKKHTITDNPPTTSTITNITPAQRMPLSTDCETPPDTVVILAE